MEILTFALNDDVVCLIKYKCIHPKGEKIMTILC